MEFKVFVCNLTKSRINYYINFHKKYAFMEIIIKNTNKNPELGPTKKDYDHHCKYFKFFCVILRDSIEELKENGIQKIRQYIPGAELPFLKDNTSWKILDQGDISIIECDIDDCILNIIKSLGINL